MDYIKTFFDASLKYAKRTRTIFLSIGIFLMIIALALMLVFPDLKNENFSGIIFVFGMSVFIILLAFLKPILVSRKTKKFQKKEPETFEMLAKEYENGHPVFGVFCQITITDNYLIYFDKNGIIYLPLSRISNVSDLTFIADKKWDYTINVLRSIPNNPQQKVQKYLEDKYGVNADLSK